VALNGIFLRTVVLACWLTPTAAAFGQSVPPPPPPASSEEATLTHPTAAQMARMQRLLDQPQALKLDERQLRFYLEIIERLPTFAEYARGYDFLHGPSGGGNPMSHDEFVRMVTPKEMYSTAGISPGLQIQWALTNWIGQALIKKALEELKQARDENQVREIRERIDRELDALTAAKRDRIQSDRSTAE
jgi:hypothetical protein